MMLIEECLPVIGSHFTVTVCIMTTTDDHNPFQLIPTYDILRLKHSVLECVIITFHKYNVKYLLIICASWNHSPYKVNMYECMTLCMSSYACMHAHITCIVC